MTPEVCSICNKPVEAGEPRNGATGDHWNCGEELRRIVAEVVSELPPKSSEAFYTYRTNGGFKVHLKRIDSDKALCGHVPKRTARHMVTRGRWIHDSRPAVSKNVTQVARH